MSQNGFEALPIVVWFNRVIALAGTVGVTKISNVALPVILFKH